METTHSACLVLLGASNLTLAFADAVRISKSLLPGPLEILAACGHGRSYGVSSRVLGRELPGIAQCGLWRALGASPASACGALLTDIGNDIMYGVSVATIASWIERDLDQLAARRARLVIARLPLDTIDALPRWRFQLVRSLIFPARRLGLDEVREKARALDEKVLEMGRARGAVFVEPEAGWYGFDPIHIKRSVRGAAWTRMLAPLCKVQTRSPIGSLHREDRRSLRRLRPEWRRIFGREQRFSQPCVLLRDGTTIALY